MKQRSLQLFNELRAKFREITWHSHGLETEADPVGVNGLIRNGENLLLAPGFIGCDKPIPHSLPDPQGCFYPFWTCKKELYSAFQVRIGGLNFNFTFDPLNADSLQVQIVEAIRRAILDGPLKGRRFYMDPAGSEMLGPIRVRFSMEGEPVPGFTLGTGVTCYSWKFFIPDGSERKLIQTAMDLEFAREDQLKYLNADPYKEKVDLLQAQFEKQLAAV